ncbi:hypothetical protein [Chitinimonas sp.]|uniref:hypothetical protein n=1 Tax=Chitinimonas sp. TaxID=1934313 RepID=UPI0035B23FD9
MALPRFYLFITESGLTVSSGSSAVLEQIHAFTADADGLTAFEQFIDGQRQALYYLLVDLQEEDYRAETIPHVGARNRQRIIRRRLESLYRETPYRSATPQGRESTGRRDDRFLLAALTNRLPLDQWLERINARDLRIVGVYSVTLLTARHIRRVAAIPAKALIVTRQFGSGLRQTYIADGSLRFSRLTAPEVDDHQSFASLLAGEAARARQFLASLRAIDRLEPMQVVMVCADQEVAPQRAACPDSELIHYQFLAISDFAASLGVSPLQLGDSCEPVWLRLIALRQPSNHYATPVQRKPYLFWQISRGLLATTAVAAVATIGAALWFWQQSSQLARDTMRQQQQQAAAEALYAKNAPQTQAGELTPTGMKNVVLAYRKLVEERPQLTPSLVTISGLLEQFPEVELNELAWRVSNDPNAIPEGFSDQADSNTTPAAGQVPVDGTAVPATSPYVIVAFKATLPGYELRHRDAIDLLNRINAALATRANTKVSTLALPVDTRPEKSLSINGSGEKAAAAQFAIKLVSQLPPTSPAGGAP